MHENKKTCKKCGIEKDLDCFTQSKNIKDGYENTCKKCRNDQRKKYINICQSCNKEFKASKKEAKFCNSKCQGLARRNRVIVYCSNCNKKLEVVRSSFENHKKHFCNIGCMAEYQKTSMLGKNNPGYNRIKYECDGCNKIIEVIPSRIKEQKYIFCSNECYKKNIGKFFTGENNPNYYREDFICEQCGKKFTRAPGKNRGNRVFCSRKCYMKANQLKPTTKKLQYNCDYCGKEMSLWKSRIEYTPRHYCSIECKNKGWALFYSGENAPAYNHNKTLEDRLLQRKYLEYYEWRKNVYEKDNYTCQCCGNNKGHNLNAHHILNYSEYEELRTDIYNGITLCKDCHKLFHDTYGYKNNNYDQLKDF